MAFKNNKSSREKFKALAGFDFSIIENIYNIYDGFERAFKEVGRENEFLSEYEQLIKNYGLHTNKNVLLSDYRDISHFGITQREEPIVVLLDYSLNWSDWKELYSRR